ncbi:MAG: hypothetical protein ABS89_07620, partial [Thiobacillus sp. SCN 63-1177]
ALIALFRGGDDEVLIRLMVLREIGLRADAPEWTPRELESHFAYLSQTKLNTVLARLREHALLLWDNERRVYQLSTEGRMVLSALSNLLVFNAEQDGELGFLAAQVAAGAAVGKLAPEALSHLLARLGELEEEFAQAVASGSEFRLRAAQSKLASVQQWLDRANAVMKDLSDAGLDDGSWRLAQSIGQRQSRLLRMASVFQRELAAIARQQVHLSQGGLSTSELAAWLKTQSPDSLAALADGRLAATPESVFVLPDVMLDNTEEFVTREQPARKTSAMPAPAEIEYTRDVPLGGVVPPVAPGAAGRNQYRPRTRAARRTAGDAGMGRRNGGCRTRRSGLDQRRPRPPRRACFAPCRRPRILACRKPGPEPR